MIRLKFLGLSRGIPCFQVSSQQPFTATQTDATSPEEGFEPVHIDLLESGTHVCVFGLCIYDRVLVHQDSEPICILLGEEARG